MGRPVTLIGLPKSNPRIPACAGLPPTAIAAATANHDSEAEARTPEAGVGVIGVVARSTVVGIGSAIVARRRRPAFHTGLHGPVVLIRAHIAEGCRAAREIYRHGRLDAERQQRFRIHNSRMAAS